MSSTTRTYTASRAQLQAKFDAAGTYPIKVILVTGYVYSEAHEFVDDVTTEITTGSVTRLTLSGITSVAADSVWTGDAADPTWTGVTFTDANAAIVFADEGADSASPLLGCIEFGALQSVTADDFTLAFPSAGLFRVTGEGAGLLADLGDVDTTTTPPADLDSLMFNNTSGKWEPGVPAGTGGTFAVVDAVVAADAVDGTGDQFTFIGYDRGGAGGGIVPASWVGVEGFIDVDAATLAGGITALYGGSATFLVYSGSVWSVRTVTDATVTDPWPAVTAYNIVGSVAGILDSGVFYAADADSIAATGAGLDAGFFKVGEILRNHEGTLDRWFFASAVGTTDKDVSDLGSETWEYGALNFTDGNGDPTTHCHVWLKNQTDPAETGMYSVAAGTFVATKFVHPDVFDPPGMGYRVTLLYPGDASNGTTWIWMADDPAIRFRANGETDAGQVGDWVLYIDPAGGGSGDVVGPASATNNSLARFDGTTGKLLKDGAVIGTDVQAYDADLAAIAALAPSNDDILQRKAGAWTNRTPAQVKTDLAIPLPPDPLTGYASGYGYFIPGALVVTAATAAAVSTNRNQNEFWTFDEDMTIIPAMEWAVAGGAGTKTRLWVCAITAGTWQPSSVVHDFGQIAVDSTANTVTEWGASHTFTRGSYLARWVTDSGATFKGNTVITRGLSIGGSGGSSLTNAYPLEGAASSGAVSATNTTAFTVGGLSTLPTQRIKVRRV